MIHSLKTKQAYKGITIAAPLVGLFILTACGGSSPAPAEETGLPNIDFMGVIEQPDADTANDGTIADDSMSIMIDDLMDDLRRTVQILTIRPALASPLILLTQLSLLTRSTLMI